MDKLQPLTHTEVQFLKELQNTMLNQDTDEQAHPRYWVIRDYRKVYGEDLNDPDGIIVYENECLDNPIDISMDMAYSPEGISAFIQYLSEIGALTDLEADERHDLEEMESVFDIIALFEEEHPDIIVTQQYCLVPMDEGFFLTKESALTHLRENSHHYDEKAHVYAKTVWRSQTETKLIELIETTDFDALERTITNGIIDDILEGV